MGVVVEHEIGKIIIFVNFENIDKNPLKIHKNARIRSKYDPKEVVKGLNIDNSMYVIEKYFFKVVVDELTLKKLKRELFRQLEPFIDNNEVSIEDVELVACEISSAFVLLF